MTYTPPCEADPDKWFTDREGRRYDDELLVTETELRASLVLDDSLPKPSMEVAEQVLADLTAAKVKERLRDRRHAKDACHLDCKVRLACLDAALGNREQYGIWGGYLPEERRQLERAIDARVERRKAREGS